MAARVRIFIDFWNFQINWNERTGRARIKWNDVPTALLKQAEALLKDSITLEDVRVYVSTSASDNNFKRFLDWLDRQPAFRIFRFERRAQTRPVRCRECGHEVPNCPSCSKAYQHSPEKGVDTGIVTDLLSLAWEGGYNLAILVSSDADFVPAVTRLQEKGLKVINATWHGHGFDLAKTSWASFDLDTIVGDCRDDPKP